VFEHADRHDAIEHSIDVPIVLQCEMCRMSKSGSFRPLGSNRELLPGQRHPGCLRSGRFREIQRHAAKAASDVEYALTFFDKELGGDMPLLGQLSLLERYV
jgi:hypothetical protein